MKTIANRAIMNMSSPPNPFETLWKFVLEATSPQDLVVRAGAELLYAREQRGDMCVWARVDTDAPLPMETRTIHIVGTGHEMPKGDLRFLGSCHMQGGTYVFHVFEERSAFGL